MIPICKSENDFLIVLALVRRVRVRDDERATKTIWVLSLDVGVIPVSSRLSYLVEVSLGSNSLNWCKHTVKL